jgi:rRNA maturation RNase YbeY
MNENKPDIQLFNESGKEIPVDAGTFHKCIAEIERNESCSFSLLEVVYVDEPSIIDINKEYLDRDYVTDIITFRYDENSSNENIEGTLYCCAQRIYEQSSELNEDPETEFKRILIHGLLHLCGYDDQAPESKKEMTEKENFYLQEV